MTSCFICKVKLYGERTRVCTSVAPHSSTLYPEIIANMLGDDYVIIVTPADQMCKKCSSLINHMDKCENDARLIRNVLVLNIHKQYGVVAPDKAVNNVEVVNKHLMTEERKNQSLGKVPGSLPIGVTHTATTNPVITLIPTPLKLSKARQQPQQLLRHQQEEITKKVVKMFKCNFCTYQSVELGHVRFHMQIHAKRIEAEKPSIEKPIVEKPIVDQAAATTLSPVPQQKKRFYRCQVCSQTFGSRLNCLDHIQEDHFRATQSTSNRAREAENSRPVTTQGMIPEPSNIQENNQLAETPMDMDENQKYKDNGTVDTDMMLNDNVLTEGHGDVQKEIKTENSEDEEETENFQEDAIIKKEPEPAQEEETEA